LFVIAGLLVFAAVIGFTDFGPKLRWHVRASGSSQSNTYFGTEPPHAAYLPRPDTYCAARVVRNSWEPRQDNYRANHTVLQPPFGWATKNDGFAAWDAKLAKVTGNFTGTTSEIIQWAACKWGIDEDTIRAAAVEESSWRMSYVSDVCGPPGEGSYGILQIKNKDCSNAVVHGGYPATTESTALVADWYAARVRSCYDGDFYDGGSWLYGGQTVDQIAAQHGWDYVFWSCIGFHYSGTWSPGQPYELSVRRALANRAWGKWRF
jgi:autotransporter family porin